jgi:rubrerythrin
MVVPDLTSLEALGVAIRAEMDANAMYTSLANRVRNQTVKNKLLFLANEEAKHRDLLTARYQEMFPGVEMALPDKIFSEGSKGAVIDQMSLVDVMNVAIGAEKKARAFYLDAAKNSIDPKGKMMFEYLAQTELSHQHILTSELRLLKRNPEYFLQPGVDMMFFGP